jgi:hypothetical protein
MPASVLWRATPSPCTPSGSSLRPAAKTVPTGNVIGDKLAEVGELGRLRLDPVRGMEADFCDTRTRL